MLASIIHLRPVMGQYISFSAPFYALLTAVFLLVFFKMMGLLKRESFLRQKIVNLYYLYLPMVLVLCASAWMYTVGEEWYVVTTLEEKRADFIAVSRQSMGKTWEKTEAVHGLEKKVTVSAMSQSLATELAKTFVEDGRFLLDRDSLDEITGNAFDGFVLRLDNAIGKDMLSYTAQQDEFPLSTLKEQWLGSFSKQVDEGLVIDALLDEIRYRFITFFKKIQLFFLFLSVPVIMEIGYALYQRPPLSEEEK